MDDQNFDDPRTAKEWINSVEQGHKRKLDIYPRLIRWAQNSQASKFLDIGCGQGACSEPVEFVSHYVGVEPSALLLARAIELYQNPKRKFVLGGAYALPFTAGEFDAAFSVAVWHLLSDPSKAASELNRVLKASGHFLIITANPMAYELWTSMYKDTRLEGRRFEGVMQLEGQKGSTDVLYLHTQQELLDIFDKANLNVDKIETFRAAGPQAASPNYFLAIQGQKNSAV